MNPRATLAVCVLGLVAGCQSSESIVVVTVDAMPAVKAVASLHFSATAGTKTVLFDDRPDGGASFDIPPQRSIGVVVPTSLGSHLSVHVEARNDAGNVIAAGDGDTSLRSWARSNITIVL